MQDKLFSFKQKSTDFIVEEELPFNLSGKGDAFFVFFEKRNINTMDVVNHLCNIFNISRLTLGIAGLKDKKAIARQRICIYKSALKKLGGEKLFLQGLSEKVKIIKTDWNEKPIGMTTPIRNIFHIRLRANKHLSLKERETTSKKIDSLCKKGFPNLFGSQRFGVEGINPKQGKDILDGKLNLKEKQERLFKIQSYASKMCNEYIYSRIKKGIEILDGDIIEIIDPKNFEQRKLGVYQSQTDTVKLFDISKRNQDFFYYPSSFQKEIPFEKNTMMITAPVIGYNLLLADPSKASGIREKSFLDLQGLNPKSLNLCKEYKIFGIRRPIRVFPQKVKISHQGDDILLNFGLPSGSYASIMIEELQYAVGVQVSFDD
ncbi:tRNA pseudouridine(13) synthase TruD [Candidatus Gracilibacteria bacterium]|nr:tRNA pseudouridine(13) synthase TruD [Candidatus Gracilibacteria bacterium]